jgi:hypothetical protein
VDYSMTIRNFVDKNGNSWEWEETAETVKAVQELAKFAGNYPGPLYAPHPDLKNENASKS